MTAKSKEDRIAVTPRGPVPLIVLTGRDQSGIAERARGLGAMDQLLKSLNESQSLAAIGKVVEIL